ncbi:alpha/beta fold hydrolase [Belliella pelovolcani]|uniref:Pimeloyl-ACP methyl ester carboxylesterase n=1 Tax=Belliella pelovolcani TaxID=529505 RepID=A0A1N7PNT2_9BACT|nr:alpha/beta hydrolase [Belliella pelovolcani]SIT12137.1 Pimeloyl-ACP methyl ester carboxylesterase [Belliella pelovolcani]
MKYILFLASLLSFQTIQAQNLNSKNMIDLHYEIKGTGNPIVLIHGGGTDSRVWSAIVDQLASSFKVITYDLRGHGQSPSPSKPTQHIEDLNILLADLKLNNVSLIGHSLGGQIATDFTILNPKKVDKLVLISPGLTGFKYDDSYQEMAKRMWAVVPNSEAMLKIMLYSPEAYAMQETIKSPFAEEIELIHQENIEKSLKWSNFEQIWPLENTEKRLSEIKIPIALIIGTEDKKDIFKIVEKFSKLTNTKLYQIQNADHGLIVTHAQEIYTLLINSLK